jgi:hypothetical protein
MSVAYPRATARALRRPAASLCLAVLLLPLAVFGQSGGGPFTLRMKFTPGEVTKLQTKVQLDTNVPLPGKATPMTQKMVLDMLQQVKVLKALPDGGGVTETTILNSSGMMNGQPIHIPTDQPITTTLDARGNALSVKGLSNSAPGMAVLNNIFNSGGLKTTGSYLPVKPVRIGDTWTEKISLPGFSGSGYAVSQLVRLEKVGHFQTARIHSRIALPLKMMLDAAQKPTMQESQAVGTMSGTLNMIMDSNFAITEGKSARSAGSGSMAMTITFKTPTPGGKSGASKAPPAGSKSGASAANVPAPVKLDIKIQVGNNLVE